MSGYMTRFGFLELTSLNIDAKFNKEDLVKYIDDINFDPATIDNVLPKQYFNYYAMSYRNSNDNVARDEKIAYDKALKQERIRRERLDTINGFFIPRSLEESFLQLDKIMPEKERKILVSLENQPISIILTQADWVYGSEPIGGESLMDLDYRLTSMNVIYSILKRSQLLS